MRMPNQTKAGQSKRPEGKKVHPQLPGSRECGCLKSREMNRPKESSQEKCIRNRQKAGDADA